MMRGNKTNLLKLLECKQLKQKNEIKEFCMLRFSRLVECRYLNEAKEFVMHGFMVLTSQYHTKNVQESLQIIQKRIEQYPSLPDTLKQLDEMPDNVRKERPPDDAELLQHLVGDEMQKSKKQ